MLLGLGCLQLTLLSCRQSGRRTGHSARVGLGEGAGQGASAAGSSAGQGRVRCRCGAGFGGGAGWLSRTPRLNRSSSQKPAPGSEMKTHHSELQGPTTHRTLPPGGQTPLQQLPHAPPQQRQRRPPCCARRGRQLSQAARQTPAGAATDGNKAARFGGWANAPVASRWALLLLWTHASLTASATTPHAGSTDVHAGSTGSACRQYKCCCSQCVPPPPP